MSDKEQGVPLDGICDGAVGIVLKRMESHPDEFFSEVPKWKFIYTDYFREVMNEAEKGMIFDALKKLRKIEFSQKVLTTLVEKQEESDEIRREREVSLQYSKSSASTTFGQAQRVGTKVGY